MKKWDVFISHASEDKEEIARPLYNQLTKLGLMIWYDEAELKKGRNTATQISNSIKESQYIVVIYSPNYIKEHKRWTKSEESLASYLSIEEGTIIIPIYHKTTKEVLEDIDGFIKPNLAFNSENDDLEAISKEIAKDIFESNLINIFTGKIELDELKAITLEKVSHLDDPNKNRIQESEKVSELLKWAYRFDCNFIPILKELQSKTNIRHTDIENYIKLLQKLNTKNCIDKRQNSSHAINKIVGIVVDITLTDINKDLYTVEVGVKYEDNTFKVKYSNEDIYITEKNSDNLKKILSALLKNLILDSKNNFAIETLIEFILPITLLEIDFKDLIIITKRREQEKCLIEYYNYIIRSKERIDYHMFNEDTNWINNWNIYQSNKESIITKSLKEINRKQDIKIKIAKKHPCIVQNFSLKESIDDIIDYGISIVMSPLPKNNFSEFHQLVSDAFSKKKLCCLYQEYNNFMRDNYEDKNRSHMLILWDDPTTIPNKENRKILNKGVAK